MDNTGLAMSRFAYYGIPDNDDFDPTTGEFESDVPAVDADFELPARDINDDLTGNDTAEDFHPPVPQLNSFDYRQLDAETRIVVQQEDKDFDRNMGDANRSFIHACKNLRRIREALKYNREMGFEKYCASKNIPTPTAYKMLNVAEMSIKFIDIPAGQFGKSALYLLAAPSTPEPARQEALARAQAGERITHSEAKEIVNGHKTEQCSCGQVGAFPRGSWTCDGCLTYCSKLEAQYEDKRGLVCKKCHHLRHVPEPAKDENLPAWLTEDEPPIETPEPKPATRLTDSRAAYAPQPNRNGVESTAPAAPSPQLLTADNWTVGYCPNCRYRYILNNDTIDKNLFVGCPQCHQPHRAADWLIVPDSQLLTPDSSRNGMSQPMAVFMSSGENEWYTPASYIDRARQVLGRIDLDPASSDIANQVIQAATWFTSETDGLSQLWPGRVWLNPPFDASAEWSSRLAASYEAGQTEAAILLVKVAFGYNWFNELWENYPVCLARERISFVKSDGTVIGPHKVGSAFFYFGPDFDRFAATFADVGRIIEPE